MSQVTPNEINAPVDKLVDVVLINIFLMVARDKSRFERHDLHLGYHKLNMAPLFLSQVCREWRFLARTTPHLWTTMQVLNADSGVENLIRHVYLPNSRNCLLDVKLKQTVTPGFSSPHKMRDQVLAINAVLHLWFRNAGRLRSMNIATQSGECLDGLPLLAVGSTPHLKSVKLWCTDVKASGNSSHLATIHQNRLAQRAEGGQQVNPSDLMHEVWSEFVGGDANVNPANPYVRDLLDNILTGETVQRARWLPTYAPKPEDLKHLNRYTVFNPNIPQALEAISFGPKLEHLEIYNIKNTGLLRIGFMTTLPHLHTLSLIAGLDDVTPIFTKLTLPQLKTLKVAPVRDVDSLLRMIERSDCKIERLDLGAHKELPAEDLERLLEHTSFRSLKRLMISQFEIKSSTLLSLTRRTYGSRQIYPLPSLQDLTLNYIRESDGILANMVESRYNKDGSGLRTLLVYVCSPKPKSGIVSIRPDDMYQRINLRNPKDFERLSALQKQGLELAWLSVHGRVTVWNGQLRQHKAQTSGGPSMLNLKDVYDVTVDQGVCGPELELKDEF